MATENGYDKLAEQVAKIILEQSHPSRGVQDVLLFGSTARGELQPKDIDLCILFDEGAKKSMIDFYQMHYEKETDGRKTIGEGILSELGSPVYHESVWTLRKSGVMAIALNMALAGNGLSADFGFHEDWLEHPEKYARQICRKAYASAKKPCDEAVVSQFWADVEAAHEKLKRMENAQSVLTLVDGVFAGIERAVTSVLDLRVVPTNILDPESGHGAYNRREGIKNSPDPTFPHTMFSTGVLYDRFTGMFSMPLEEKYPGSLVLFPATAEAAAEYLK